jgi:hypothetical protein
LIKIRDGRLEILLKRSGGLPPHRLFVAANVRLALLQFFGQGVLLDEF